MTSLRVGGLSVAGATGRITGGAGDAATAAVGTGGVGADAGDGAGGALGVATGAAGVTTVAVVTRAPDNGGADEHAAPRNTAHSAVHVVRRVRAEVNVEAIEGDSAMTRGEPLPALGRTLYVVATPIGNLRDITLRALDILGQVDVIAAEDTRVTGVLISHYGIRAQLLSLNEHNERRRAAEIVKLLDAGKRVALVTDAGTPAISDPGAALVRAVGDAGFAVVPVPGPSAVIAALSAAGLDASPWLFFGFLPATAAARSARTARRIAVRAGVLRGTASHQGGIGRTRRDARCGTRNRHRAGTDQTLRDDSPLPAWRRERMDRSRSRPAARRIRADRRRAGGGRCRGRGCPRRNACAAPRRTAPGACRQTCRRADARTEESPLRARSRAQTDAQATAAINRASAASVASGWSRWGE